MDIGRLMKLESVRELFAARKDEGLKEDSRLLLEAMEEVRFEPGEDVVTWGRPGKDGMYIILDGTAHVFNQHGELINTPMGTGSIIGEMALIREEPRGATVRAATQVLAARLTKEQFEKAAGINRKLYGALLDLAYRKTTDLVREQARIHSELEIAARIQNGLLRRDFLETEQRMGIRVSALMEPAREVGGDFYDVFQISEDRACFVIADVSGKGVPAALFMTMAKTHIKNYGMLDMPLSELAFRVNNQLCMDNGEEMFVTALIGVLDKEKRTFTFVNAGHNHPYTAPKEGDFSRFPCRSDLVFGLWENREYQEQTLDLNKTGCIFFYTDGVTEAENRDGEMFGDSRLCETLNCVEDRRDPARVARQVSDVLASFQGEEEQSDDITMLCLWTGSAETGSARDVLEQTVPARMEYLDILLKEADRYLARHLERPEEITKLEIALEEIFTNVVNYAYGKEEGELNLSCLLDQGEGSLVLRLKDRGVPFNPLGRKEPDLTLPLEQRPVGGLGIFMVKKFVDQAEYEYRDGCNILTLKKKIVR